MNYYKIGIILIFIFNIILSAELTKAEISSVINQIKKKREAFSISISTVTPDPFMLNSDNNHSYVADKKDKPKKTIYKLSAILNNSALINGKWYKLGDKIDNSILNRITFNYVLIKDSTNKIIKLLIKKKQFIRSIKR